MTRFDETLNHCISKWRNEGIKLEPPLTEAAIRRLWDHFGMPVSADVLRLYTTLGGFKTGEYEEGFFWYFWPIDDVIEINTKNPSPGIRFCDHSIHIVDWEIRFENPLISSVWRVYPGDPEPPDQVADDLQSFFRIYLDDPYQLV